jgi:hypothetical protein
MANNSVTPYQKESSPLHVSPYIDFSALAVLSDTVDTPQPFKMVIVSAPGFVTWLNLNGDSQITYCGIPGQPYYIRGKRLMATGTTATGIYWGGGQ